jgi:DMSO/TMAO reductase YedYZ molybdopterin-dependent catalytic subunit
VSASLHVGGEVATTLDLDFASLRALAQQVVEPSALLAGREIAAVPLAALLDLADAQASAQSLVAESSDGSFRTTLPLDAVNRCVVVYRIGGSALPRVLGGPFRLVTNGRLRCGDVKALSAIVLSKRPFVVEQTETGPISMATDCREHDNTRP